jgi:signal transduction histidine kinase/putative methionine-R-sulfoxide reductase with GAF domain
VSSEAPPEKAPLGEESAARLREQLHRERRVSRALREVGTALGTTLDLDDLLELILAKLTELVEADRATLYLLDEARDELVSKIVAGEEVRSIRMKVGHGIAGLVAKSGEPIRVEDAYRDARFEREWDVLTGYRTTSMLVAPLKNHVGRTIGVLQVLNKRGGRGFTDDDEAILGALGTQAAVAIDNSRLVLSLIQKNKQLLDTKEQLERKFRELSLLFELERATARADSIDALARATLEQITRASDARGAALLLADDETGDLVERVYDRERPDALVRRPAKPGEGFLGAAMNRTEPLLLESAVGDSRANETFPFLVASVLAIPLEGESEPLGALGLFTADGERALGETDTGLLRLVAVNVSTAVRLFNASRARELGERLTSIGRLLSQVIHDFKTPMTVISGHAQLMVDEEQREARQEHCEQILQQFDVLSAMQREVLDFARGKSTIFVRRVYLRKFFAELERQIRLEIEGMGIELVMAVESKLVARFDEARVARAIHNLARNAIEAMGENGGRLEIAAELTGDELVISVSDSGPGIPAEVEGRMFQSFVTSGKRGGTGLGLAIVKKIVDEHSGRIEVKSSQSGAKFVLRLPQTASEPGHGAETQPTGRER